MPNVTVKTFPMAAHIKYANTSISELNFQFPTKCMRELLMPARMPLTTLPSFGLLG